MLPTREAWMNIRYRVDLSEAERSELQTMLSGGKHSARKLKHSARKLKRAQILLASHAGQSDEAIAASVAVSASTVRRTKRRFVEGNLERALSEGARPGAARKLSGQQALGPGGGAAGRHRLLQPARGPRPLDP